MRRREFLSVLGGTAVRRFRIARYWSRMARPVCACVGTTIFLLATLGAATAEPKRVLMLHSFGRDFKPWSEYARTIRAELDRQSPWPLEIAEHSLMTARSSDENPEAPFVEYLHALHAKRPVDLIVSLGAPAVAFVQRHRQQLFTTTPMVFTAVEQRRVQHSILTPNDTVVAIAQNFPAVIKNILRVLPDTKTVAVVTGNSPNERFWLEVLRKEFAPFEDRLAFIWYNDRSFADISKHAAALPPHSAIYWHQMNVDAAGVVHEGDKALPTLYAVANAPIFSFTDAFFGGEVVGGPMNSVVEASRMTVAVAVRILGGEKAGDIKVLPIGFATPKFDWRQMQRWGISERRLLPGSEIHFRDPTVWEQYRTPILAIGAALLIQAALITWLLYERRKRHRSDTAQEDERSRLARALHDDVTQRLAALAIDAGRAERNSGPTGGAAMRSMREGLVRLSEDVHALSFRLHPSILEDLGLIEALKAECERFSQCPVRLEVNTRDIPDALPQDVALCLFRIAQEGLRNVARHAGARQIEVSLRRLGRGLELAVKDDGAGFDAGQRRAGMSLGLSGMRQRVALLGGKIDIESSSGHGTTILAWVPLREPSDLSERVAG
jgi:signal transduction histidine kinase